MANTILTPITLWKDFDDSLPLNEEVISEYAENGATVREVYYYGRQTGEGRVKIYARCYSPEGEERYPAVMLLFEAGMRFDEKLVDLFIKRGYAVLCVDYCGENDTDKYTIYPADVDYANYVRAGRYLEYAEPTAKETSWYEWAGVARYSVRYLREKPEVTEVGALGLRTGGEILFKIAPYAPLACMISVCAAGWLAYRDLNKYSEDNKPTFNEERYRFIAGVESQSYAAYVNCPVLLLSAVNDRKSNHDRVYDTFRLLNPAIEKAILFSAHGNGLIGSHSFDNIFLFLNKYLRGRSVFVGEPLKIVTEVIDGNLMARGICDESGDIEDCGFFFTEKVADSKTRDWTRVLGEQIEGTNEFTAPLCLFEECRGALVYSFVRYSNGFSVTSNVCKITIEKPYRNSSPRSRIIYNNADGYNGFSAYRLRSNALADCFKSDGHSDLRLEAGFGGIAGITADTGIASYRVGEPKYCAPEGVSFRFDAYAAEDAQLFVTFYCDTGEEFGYSVEVAVEGGGRWKSIMLDPLDFKSVIGVPLPDFSGVVSVVFFSEKEVLVNNVLWI